ncbi:MAG: AMP-binding protein [Acidimicrobiales bacterium]|nr:AMP-binding protein [Acidimicrobiales bacterium]
MSIVTRRGRADDERAVALADATQELTWDALDQVLNRIGNALLTELSPGADRVAIFAENALETVAAHLGAIGVGVSSVPVSFHLTEDELAYILKDSGSRLLLVGPETAPRGVAAAQQAGITVVGWRCEGQPGVEDWDAWLARADASEPPTDVPPRPFLHYTSGTTGLPKGTDTPPAMFAGGETLEEHFDNVAATNLFTGTNLIVSPVYHTGPLSTLRALAAGTRLVVLGRFDPEGVLRAIDRYKVTSTVMVPTHFARLLSLPEDVRKRYDLSSLAVVAHTGASCPVEVKRRMIDWFGPVLIEAYGATESGTTNMITSPEWLEHPGSVGRTLPPFEVVVVSEEGEELPTGEVGVLYFRDTTGRGIRYHNDPEKTAKAHRRPGEFTLGDVGYVDPDGYVYITDRTSDMVISGGVNIYPAEAEAVLLEHPAVDDVACIGVPHIEMGEQLQALVVLRAGEPAPTEAELIDFARGRIAHYKCPRSVDFVEDLGRNAMGKLNKRALRAPYWPSDRTIGG